MKELRDGKISDLLIRYGVYNQSGIDAFALDLELNIREVEELTAILKSIKKVYENREKMGVLIKVWELQLKEDKKKYLDAKKDS